MKYKYFSILLVFIFGGVAYAEVPAINSFNATRGYVNSSAPLSLSWVVDSTKPSSVKILCPTGVRLWTMSGTATSYCGTDQVIGDTGSGGLDLIATNVSGSAQTISAILTPADSSGTLYPAAAKTVYVTVGADTEPITSFSSDMASSSNAVDSYMPVTFTWTSRGTTGVNFTMSCVTSILATSTSVTNGVVMPCNRSAFSSDLAASGNLTVYLYNNANSSVIVRFTILPAMDTGLFDNGHTKYIDITVRPYKAPTFTGDFTADPLRILSTGSTTLSWSGKNTAGVNFKAGCSGDFSFVTYASSTMKQSDCGQLLFDQALPVNGTTSIKIINGMDVARSVPLLLLPQLSSNTYDAQSAKTVSIMVEARSVKILPAAVPATSPGVGTAPGQAVSTLQKGLNAYKFTKYMERGARGAEVTALQNYLKQFKDVYPEGLVTGYYGAATEKAVQRFQIKNGLAKTTDPGYGVVGPKTRATLNTAQ